MVIFDLSGDTRAEQPGRCYCCFKELRVVTGPAHYRHEFRSLLGVGWPGSISLNLHQDLRSLGLETANAPERATVCLVCAVDSMKAFNARHSCPSR